ncbi:MAG: phosphomannomutase [Proteobacteria bacterium]|nr:phosphomannomutase [Pseudomonadota bacterium]
MTNPEIFLNTKPIPIKFGTSGLRALVTELTDLECYINICGFVDYLKQIGKDKGGIDKGATIYLAGDLRPSTPRIMKAIAKAIEDCGCGVINCGFVPTPAATYCGMQRDCASIMVTGSHIPEDRNGIKPNKVDGEVLKHDEPGINECIAIRRGQLYSTLGDEECLFNKDAMFITEPVLPKEDETQREFYIRRYVDVFSSRPLEGKKIVVYQHSSVGRDIVVEILEKLGAEIIKEGRCDEFVSVDTEAIREEDVKLMKKWAEIHKPFALVSFDGDCDRPWLSDENGTFLRGDLLGVLSVLYLDADFSAVPVSCSDAVDKVLSHKIKLVKTKIGSPYVVKTMIEATRDGFKKAVGWEVNGGFLTQCDLEINNKTLKALPTRDAVLPLICALLLAIKKGQSVLELINSLPKRFTDADKIKEFPTSISRKIVEKYSPVNKDIEIIEFDDKIKVTFKNGNTNTVENTDQFGKKWLEKKKDLEEKYFKPHGVEKITSMIFIDGVRIITENEDIIHLRPSNNAPEFRCYSNANSQERAVELVRMGLDKIVPKMGEEIQAE